ncbi:MAG: pseudouridine synthase [Cyanobacteria bacterium J06626_6]
MFNEGWTYTDAISAAAAGQSVLAFYTQRYRHSDQATWQARISAGQILLDGQPTTPHTRLARGQQLTYERSPWQEPTVPLNFPILYEDAHLWAIAKPSGLPVLPGGRFLQHTVLYQMQQRHPGEQPAPVHRLGRGTSGILLIAKSQQARAVLARQFREHTTQASHPKSSPTTSPTPTQQTFQKTYRALIGPTTPAQFPAQLTCTYPIGKHPYPQLGYLYAHTPNGLPAKSTCTVLQRRPTSTLLDVSIQTGRPHQIRIHLAAAGYPLLGDPLYTTRGIPYPQSAAIPSDCGYHLHAHRIQFSHPQTGKFLSIEAPPPSLLQPTQSVANPNQTPQ